MSRRENKRKVMGRLVKQWQESGLSCAQFARQVGIPTSQFRYWVGLESRSLALSPGFIPIQIFADERFEASPCFELTLADGRRLVIPPELTGAPLRELLVTLGSC